VVANFEMKCSFANSLGVVDGSHVTILFSCGVPSY